MIDTEGSEVHTNELEEPVKAEVIVASSLLHNDRLNVLTRNPTGNATPSYCLLNPTLSKPLPLRTIP